MAAIDSNDALNCRIQLRRAHRRPARYAHDTPSCSRSPPAVIVGACDQGEVERVREFENIGAPLLQNAYALWSAIAQLHGVQPRVSLQLVLWEH